MASHHDSLKALGPINWDDVPQDGLKTFMNDTFTESQTAIDSIPSTSTDSLTAGRARSQTDSSVAPDTTSPSPHLPSPEAAVLSEKLKKEWKEVKLNAKDNPLGMKVYKLPGKDGKGAWFARQSIHEDLSFDSWKSGMEREFAETMKTQGNPGSGNIRGIGADKRVEHNVVKDAGELQVYQLSAQFPGPTAPRDFITLLLTSDFSHAQSESPRSPKQYMVVSKPVIHSECPPRQGIIRGQYESVELIREVPAESFGSKGSPSSADLAGSEGSATLDRNDASSEKAPAVLPAIEWLMITRSDPGGSVPRFLIEKGTPPGIVGDAGKFLKWISSRSADESSGADADDLTRAKSAEAQEASGTPGVSTPTASRDLGQDLDDEPVPSSNGLYGIITGAFGAASSVVAGGLRKQFSGYQEDDPDDSSSETAAMHEDAEVTSPSETSSVHSFASALEKSLTKDKEESSIHSQESKTTSNQSQEKELKRLQDRRRKLDEKAAKMQERIEQKRSSDKEKDAAALVKAREKHEKEIAKQEAKYQREIKKLEEKREQEAKRADERKRKAIEREEKSNLALELERTRVERDVALKKIEILEHQVGELQAQNTTLAAKLGRQGALDGSDSASMQNEAKGVDKAGIED